MKFLLGILLVSSFFLASCDFVDEIFGGEEETPVVETPEEAPEASPEDGTEEGTETAEGTESAEEETPAVAVDEEGSPSDTAAQVDSAPATTDETATETATEGDTGSTQ